MDATIMAGVMGNNLNLFDCVNKDRSELDGS